jgi:glutamyl-tRNA reductase
VGGGKVAARRVRTLLSCGARIKVLAPRAEKSIALLSREGKIRLENRPFLEEDLDGQFLVLALTDNRELNERIWRLCAERGILCCGNGISGYGHFIFPSVLKKGGVTISVSTGGNSPALSRWIREELEGALVDEVSQLSEIISKVRAEVHEGCLHPRYEDWRAVIDEDILSGLREGYKETERLLLEKVKERLVDKSSLCLWGISHKTAPLEFREKILKQLPEERELFRILNRAFPNALFLSTCNRIEICSFSQELVFFRTVVDSLWKLLGGENDWLMAYSYFLFGSQAVLHILRVASGLDSAAEGEFQVRNQVKKAAEKASAAGCLSFPLNHLVELTLKESKRINQLMREERGFVSVSGAAVRRLLANMKSLAIRKVLVIGTGEAGKEMCYQLKKLSDCDIMLMGGHEERVKGLSGRFGARPLSYRQIRDALLEADAVLSASPMPGLIIETGELVNLMKKRDFRPLLVIDISVPRDFPEDCRTIPGIFLVGIDDLFTDPKPLRGNREKAELELAAAAERITRYLAERGKAPDIISIRCEAEEIWKAETEKLCRKLGLKDERQKEIVKESVRKTINRVLHKPTLLIKKERAILS